MTIASILNRISYDGNGATTAFPISFPFQLQTDLVVVETVIATGVQTTKTLTTHYTISGTTDTLGFYPNGGTVNAVVAPAATVRWTIYRDPTPTQSTDLVENDSLPAESTEAALDRQTMLIQRVSDLITRSLHQPDGDATSVGLLPSAVARALKFLSFDVSGNPIAAAGTSADLGPVSSFINTLLDDADAPTARGTLGFSDIAAKGDLLVGTANDTIATLPVGTTTGHALIVNPSDSTGLSWGPRAQDNPIINGTPEVWQRGTTFAAIAAGTSNYTADRWYYYSPASAAVVTVNRSTNVPTVAQAGVLFNYSLEIDVTTADASVAATDHAQLTHVIEGYNWRHFAQRQFTLSFWAMSSKTGIHSVQFRNNGVAGSTARCFVGEYTINVADTWEAKTVTVSASPSAGTWDYINGSGVTISFGLMGGTNFHETPGSWVTPATSFMKVSSNQVNVLDNTANFFRITGVKMELGSVATPIQFVPFEVELARAKRYYQKSFSYATTPAQNIGTGTGEYVFPSTGAGAVTITSPSIGFAVVFRATPTMTLFNPQATNGQLRNTTDSADLTTANANANDASVAFTGTGNAGLAVGEEIRVHWTAAAEL